MHALTMTVFRYAFFRMCSDWSHSGARFPSRVKRQVRLPKKSFSQLRSSVCRTLNRDSSSKRK